MSWKINLIGTDLSTLPSTWWNDVNTSSFTAYSSGLSIENGEVETVIDNITAANPAVISVPSTTVIADEDIIFINGTSSPTDYGELFDDYPYYRVNNSATGVSFEPQYFSPTGDSYNSVQFEALGCQPSIIDESEEIKYWAGGYRKLKKGRLQFRCVLYPLTTQGDFNTSLGNKIYWDLEKVLYKNKVFITAFGSEFERMFELMKLYPTEFKMPIEVEVYDFGTLGADFTNNADRIELSLVTKEWFTFS